MSLMCVSAFAQKEVQVKAGTIIPLRATNTVAAADVKAGDKVLFTVARDVNIDGVTAIPYGTSVSGIITLAKNATYADKETNVFIYKDFFFTTATGLAIYHLTKAKSVYHYQQTLYPENGSPYNKSFLVFETNDPDTPVRTRRIEIHNIGEDTDAHLQTFFDTLRKDFPHIEIGKTKENKK